MRMLIFTLILMVSLICGVASPSLAIMDPWDAMPAPPGFYMICGILDECLHSQGLPFRHFLTPLIVLKNWPKTLFCSQCLKA